jgi:hypothetical protein
MRKSSILADSSAWFSWPIGEISVNAKMRRPVEWFYIAISSWRYVLTHHKETYRLFICSPVFANCQLEGRVQRLKVDPLRNMAANL